MVHSTIDRGVDNIHYSLMCQTCFSLDVSGQSGYSDPSEYSDLAFLNGFRIVIRDLSIL